jgi:hypothetical protein
MVVGMVEFPSPELLGVRLVVGQQTLDLLAEVRILDPQPTPRPGGVFCRIKGGWKDTSGIILKEPNQKCQTRLHRRDFTRRSPRALRFATFLLLLVQNEKGQQPE